VGQAALGSDHCGERDGERERENPNKEIREREMTISFTTRICAVSCPAAAKWNQNSRTSYYYLERKNSTWKSYYLTTRAADVAAWSVETRDEM
jgi:hypothetical protein